MSDPGADDTLTEELDYEAEATGDPASDALDVAEEEAQQEVEEAATEEMATEVGWSLFDRSKSSIKCVR